MSVLLAESNGCAAMGKRASMWYHLLAQVIKKNNVLNVNAGIDMSPSRSKTVGSTYKSNGVHKQAGIGVMPSNNKIDGFTL